MQEEGTGEDVTQRFSDRVADYERWRPGYPDGLLQWLLDRCALLPGDRVADVGSGTGLFARALAARGIRVYAVEPNANMRAAAERHFGDGQNPSSHDGRAESTTLPSGSVDLVTAAQAFHWFEPATARSEFARVLKPGGRVAVIWNLRRDDTPFLKEYEALLRIHAPQYPRSGAPAQGDERVLRAFFAGGQFETGVFGNAQYLDAEGLIGRLMSSSYAPARGTAGHSGVLAATRELFLRHEAAGKVALLYETRAYLGRV